MKKKTAAQELEEFQKSKKIVTKFKKKREFVKRRIDEIVNSYLDLAGIDSSWKQVRRGILIGVLIVTTLLTLTVLIAANELGSSTSSVIGLILGLWTVVFAGLGVLVVIFMFLYLDFRIYQRTQQLEQVLPDFLQLTSANISAGMPIDRALWLAVRPQFGVLSEEMQEIAKSNFTGDDLEESLIRFSQRYKSRMLKESISLIIAGIESGGELGDLLAKIAENIRETQLMQKEISASVMSYVIFIGAATVGAAPVLFALSRQMLEVITTLTASFGDGGPSAIGSFSLSFSSGAVSNADFTIFAIVMIAVSSFFAAGIISTIRKGNTHDQFKLTPIFIAVGVLIYFAAAWGLGYLFSGFLG
mgnify:CR=1 FL=1